MEIKCPDGYRVVWSLKEWQSESVKTDSPPVSSPMSAAVIGKDLKKAAQRERRREFRGTPCKPLPWIVQRMKDFRNGQKKRMS